MNHHHSGYVCRMVFGISYCMYYFTNTPSSCWNEDHESHTSVPIYVALDLNLDLVFWLIQICHNFVVLAWMLHQATADSANEAVISSDVLPELVLIFFAKFRCFFLMI